MNQASGSVPTDKEKVNRENEYRAQVIEVIDRVIDIERRRAEFTWNPLSWFLSGHRLTRWIAMLECRIAVKRMKFREEGK